MKITKTTMVTRLAHVCILGFVMIAIVYLNPSLLFAATLGNHDSATCLEITGWACMSEKPTTPIDVHFYKGKSYYEGGTIIGAATANLVREQAVGNLCGGNSTHGFRYVVPAGALALNDKVFVHAINGAENPLISNTGKTITSCTVAPTLQSCQRCSNINGCEMTKFQSSDNCVNPVGEVIRTTDTVNCGPIAGGNNSRCATNVSPTPTSCHSIPNTIGSLDVPVQVASPGTYNVWVRVMTAGDSANSVYMKIDGNCPVIVGDKNGMVANTWLWVNFRDGQDSLKMQSSLTAGAHTLTFIGKESNVKVDRFLLTTSTCIPTGMGDNCDGTPTSVVTPTLIPTATPTSVPPTPTVPVTGGSNTITVYAAGSAVNNVYPSMELRINGVTVQRWDNVAGPVTKPYQAYAMTTNVNVDTAKVQVAFINDAYENGQDRNLFVDKIVVNSVTYQAEASNVYATSCGNGYPGSEALYCNGYKEFTVVPPTSQVTVFAEGSPAAGVYPTMDLYLKGVIVKRWSGVTGGIKQYSYTHSGALTRSDIRVEFSNDAVINGQDRNLRVDKIRLNSTEYQSEASTTYTTSCATGYLRREMLWCNGYFQY